MANGDQKLGRLLLDTLKGVNALILQASAAEVEELERKRETLMDEIARLVDERLDAAAAEYRVAAAALVSAAAAIERALRQMASVAEAIVRVGQAIELAASLRP